MSDTCMKHIENYWKTLTNAGNELYQQEKLQEALLKYQDALYRAEVLSKHIDQCLHLNISFVQIYIISCNNIATIYQATNKLQAAENILKRTVHYCIHLMHNKQLDKSMIYAELQRVYCAYQQFVASNKGTKTCEKQDDRITTWWGDGSYTA